jgi:uncharacterized surface protein with fasciclin (FAS1) repeats
MKKFGSLFVVVALFAVPFASIEAKQSAPTIVDIAVGNDNFDVLVAAVTKAGLVDVLNGKRQFTVFAPTDAAFETLFGATEATIITAIEGYTPEQVLDLTDILLYHVVPGVRLSPSVLGAPAYKTLNGAKLTRGELSLVPNLIDLRAKNGVVHVIDTVLVP